MGTCTSRPSRPAHLPQASRSGGHPRGPHRAPGRARPAPASHVEVIPSAGRPLGEQNISLTKFRQQIVYLENCKESTKNKD